MTLLVTVFATLASVAALAYLAATDPKRRRAFRLPAAERRYPLAAWAAGLLPGVLVGAVAGAGWFFVWLGAASVLGWGVAALAPGQAGRWWAAVMLRARKSRLVGIVGDSGSRD